MLFSFFHLFLATPFRSASKNTATISPPINVPEWVPMDFLKINDQSAVNMLKSLQRAEVKLIDSFSVNTSFIFLPKIEEPEYPEPNIFIKSFKKFSSQFAKPSPIVLVHGFDSSCLEFRKIASILRKYRDVYVIDVLGWGFGDHSTINEFGPDLKINHLAQFLVQIVKSPCVLIGASLGGTLTISVATDFPSLVEKVVLIDAQGFIDGQRESKAPDVIAKFGVSVLKSVPLRLYANIISYRDKAFATYDAMRIGRLHCLMESWERCSISFLQSGGFVVSAKVPQVKQPTLVIWGADDKILPIENAYRFQETLPQSELTVIEECGHVPHIEKPEETVREIIRFLEK